MITFSLNNEYFPVFWAGVCKSIFTYKTLFKVNSQLHVNVGERLILSSGREKTILHCISYAFTGSSYQSNFVSEQQLKVLNTKIPEYCGITSVSGLLNTLGLKTNIIDTTKSYWQIPVCSLKTLIDCLNNWSEPNLGGAIRYFLDLDGYIKYVDLKKAWSTQEVKVKGVVASDVLDTEWRSIIPGRILMYISDVDSFRTKEIVMDENMPFSKVFVNDTSGHKETFVEKAYKNDFTFRKYTSRKIQINEVFADLLDIGAKVKLNETISAIVGELMVPVDVANRTEYQTVKLVCPQ